jgi:hypothetical protein
MPDASRKAGTEIWRKTREILFREWDPICVSSNENLVDEYDSIVPRVVHAIQQGLSMAALAQVLAAEEAKLQCPTDDARRMRTARLLHDLKAN